LERRLQLCLLEVKGVVSVCLSFFTGVRKRRDNLRPDEPEDLRSECFGGLFQNSFASYLRKISIQGISHEDEPVVLYKTKMVLFEKRLSSRNGHHEIGDVFRNISSLQDVSFLFRGNHFISLLLQDHFISVLSKILRDFNRGS